MRLLRTPMICEHLRPLEEAMTKAGIRETYRGKVWGSSESIRNTASREISGRVMRFLNEAPKIEFQFQRELAHGLVDARNPSVIEPALAELLLYEEAFERYLARDFASAIDILKRRHEDPPCAILIERCRDYLREPPPQDWTGVFVAQSK